MSSARRIRLQERDSIEGGVRCPACGSYTSFGDVVATGRCSGAWFRGCEATLALDLVFESPATVEEEHHGLAGDGDGSDDESTN